MLGPMMCQPLLISALLRHAERHHSDRAVVLRGVEGDVYRCIYRELGSRRRRANVQGNGLKFSTMRRPMIGGSGSACPPARHDECIRGCLQRSVPSRPGQD